MAERVLQCGDMLGRQMIAQASQMYGQPMAGATPTAQLSLTARPSTVHIHPAGSAVLPPGSSFLRDARRVLAIDGNRGDLGSSLCQ